MYPRISQASAHRVMCKFNRTINYFSKASGETLNELPTKIEQQCSELQFWVREKLEVFLTYEMFEINYYEE